MTLSRVTLTDGVVLLRPIASDDIEALVAAIDPSVSRWTRIPWPYTRAHAADFVARAAAWWATGSDAAFAVTDAATGAFLGGTGVHRLGVRATPRSSYLPDEVGYWVNTAARGRGVATAALRLVSRWALAEAGQPLLNLQVKEGNEASRRVAKRVGYRYLGLVPATAVDDDPDDHHRYVLDSSDLAADG